MNGTFLFLIKLTPKVRTCAFSREVSHPSPSPRNPSPYRDVPRNPSPSPKAKGAEPCEAGDTQHPYWIFIRNIPTPGGRQYYPATWYQVPSPTGSAASAPKSRRQRCRDTPIEGSLQNILMAYRRSARRFRRRTYRRGIIRKLTRPARRFIRRYL